MDSLLFKRLREGRIWKRILRERMTEPLSVNAYAAFAALFGSFRQKVACDLVIRQHHAFGLLTAADWARESGVNRISAMEFGVANGAGLLNMCSVAERVTKETGVEFEIYGFDCGTGMPKPRDYRDHPEYYSWGDFPMQSPDSLRAKLPPSARLILGDISESIQGCLANCAPIGFISIDVDYYFSTVEALKVLEGPANRYLPSIVMYLDDIGYDRHNPFCGEWLAVREFTETHASRKIARFNMLRQQRLFQRAMWVERMFIAHILDHDWRVRSLNEYREIVLDNPYLGITNRSE
ncbi:MAG: hypothetical protein ABSD96_12025 [Candidatus Korobacteraceae bacterium]